MSAPLYRLRDGVHRSVAARQAGLLSIAAKIDHGGVYGPVILVPLADLYSPKDHISQFDRNRDLLTLIQLMLDPDQLARIEPVIVVPLAPRHARLFTHIHDVQVTIT